MARCKFRSSLFDERNKIQLFKRISRNISRKDEHTEPIEHTNSADHDEIYRRLSRTCIVEPTRIDDDDNPLDPSIGIRKRR